MTVCSDILKQFQLMEAPGYQHMEFKVSVGHTLVLHTTPWGYASASIGIFSGREPEYCVMPDALVSWYFFMCFTRTSIHYAILLIYFMLMKKSIPDQCWIKLHNLVKLLLSWSNQHVTLKKKFEDHFLQNSAECCCQKLFSLKYKFHLRQTVNSLENVFHKAERYFLWTLKRWAHAVLVIYCKVVKISGSSAKYINKNEYFYVLWVKNPILSWEMSCASHSVL